ncbi:G-protein coupled receptor GRL101-like [Patiria miniata]|uniref:G-protein coupled receptors family 1 profile domain-containing protein n=1 Tax=Patiria miniata TaxID=46514 RepID=A0A913ZSE9_PATMI|nr:G-protein coupled receptor GRL101-like [Patiria miniata]
MLMTRCLCSHIILFCVLASSSYAQIPDALHIVLLTEEAPQWSFQFPNYTHGFYPDEVLSIWLIRVDRGRRVTFDFDVIEIAGNDELQIGNGIDASDLASVLRDNVIVDFTGNLTGVGGARVASNGHEAWMKFQSSHVSSCRGFSVTVRQEGAPSSIKENGYCRRDDFRCVDEVEGVTCLGNGSRCDGFEQCKDASDEANCTSLLDRFDESMCRKCPSNQQYNYETQSCPVRRSRKDCDDPNPFCGCGFRGEDLAVICAWLQPYTYLLGTQFDTTHTLFLSGVNVSALQNGTFKMFPNLKQLKVLVIQATSDEESVLKNYAFDGFDSLSALAIFDINLRKIEAKAFAGLDKLETIAILEMDSSPRLPIIEDGAFDVLSDNLSFLYFNDYRLCCFFGPELQERCREWFEIPELFVCSQLVPNYVLKAFMWILGIGAVVGNLFVMVWRCREKTEHRASRMINSFLVFNLAGADALMGLYMLIIGGADVHYGARYFEVSDEWRSSAACKVAGFISIIANEASVFLLVLISVTRFMFIVFPFFTNHRLTLKVAKIVVGFVWLLTVILAVVSTVLASDEASDAYGLSDVCIGLPLTTRVTGLEIQEQVVKVGGIGEVTYARPVPISQSATWVFAIVLFLGVNLFGFCLILACYVAIFVKVKVAARRVRSFSTRDESEVRMAVKMAVIVSTDLLCWMPVIIMGILFQAGVVENNPEVFVWSVVFILPINSSINPYLYTFLDVCRKKQCMKPSQNKEEIPVESIPVSQKTIPTDG